MNPRSISLCLLFSAATIASPKLCAQVHPASLNEYLTYALQNHPLLVSAAQAKASAVYSNTSLDKSYLPQLGIASHLLTASGYDEAITNGGEIGAQLAAAYTLYDGGALTYEKEKGGLGVEQASLNMTRTRAEILYGVSIAFAGALKQIRELNVAYQRRQQLNDYLQLVTQLHASGHGSEADVLKTTVDLNAATIDIEARKVESLNTLLELGQAAGLPPGSVADVDTTTLSLPCDTVFTPSRNIDLSAQELLLRQAELETEIAGARRGPKISLGADAGALTSMPNLRQGSTNVFGGSLGVSISLPLFTFGSLDNSYNAAEANAKSISMQNAYARTALLKDFVVTKNNIGRATFELSAIQSNLAIAENNLLLSRARYAGGSGLSIEVLDAIQMVNEISLAIEESRYQRAINIFKLNRLNTSGATQE
jgi:outer membrane protein